MVRITQKKLVISWLKAAWVISALRIGGLGTGASILTCPFFVGFCSNRQTGAYSNNIGKDLRVWRQKTSLENKFPHGNGQNPIFNKKCIYNCWVFCHVRFPGINVYISGCFAILLVGFWYMLHESLVCPLTREQVLVMHLCGVQGFQENYHGFQRWIFVTSRWHSLSLCISGRCFQDLLECWWRNSFPSQLKSKGLFRRNSVKRMNYRWRFRNPSITTWNVYL